MLYHYFCGKLYKMNIKQIKIGNLISKNNRTYLLLDKSKNSFVAVQLRITDVHLSTDFEGWEIVDNTVLLEKRFIDTDRLHSSLVEQIQQIISNNVIIVDKYFSILECDNIKEFQKQYLVYKKDILFTGRKKYEELSIDSLNNILKYLQ